MLVLLIIGAIPVLGYTSEKIAVIAIDPKLDEWTFNLNSPRILDEIGWYRKNGYQIASINGTVDDIAGALLHPNVKALTFVGHGGAVGQDGSQISSLANYAALGWQKKIYWVLRERYRQRGMTDSEAAARARKESENFGLERVVNYSCWSLIDTSIADLFVKPGGLYYGSSLQYTPNPMTYLDAIWGNAQFFLEEYQVPRKGYSGARPKETIRPNPSNPGYGWKWYPNKGWACVWFRSDVERIITLWPEKLEEICGPHP